jgi:hypothetical protein
LQPCLPPPGSQSGSAPTELGGVCRGCQTTCGMGTASNPDGPARRAADAVRSLLLEIAGVAGIGPRHKTRSSKRRSKLPDTPDAVVLRPLSVSSEQSQETGSSNSATRTPPNVGRKRFVILLAVLLYLFGTIMVISAKSGTAALAGGDQWEYFKSCLAPWALPR